MRRSVSVMSVFAIVLWGSTLLVPHVKAQQSADSGLTDDSLRQMLVNMGYEPRKLSSGYLIAEKREGMTISMQLVLSKDGSRLGINANLGSVPDPDSVSAQQWRTLLEANTDIDPSAFYFDKNVKKLYIHRSMDNRAISPAVLRKHIDSFCYAVKSTDKAWSFTK